MCLSFCTSWLTQVWVLQLLLKIRLGTPLTHPTVISQVLPREWKMPLNQESSPHAPWDLGCTSASGTGPSRWRKAGPRATHLHPHQPTVPLAWLQVTQGAYSMAAGTWVTLSVGCLEQVGVETLDPSTVGCMVAGWTTPASGHCVWWIDAWKAVVLQLTVMCRGSTTRKTGLALLVLCCTFSLARISLFFSAWK